MDLIQFLNNDLITENTKELTPSKLFLKTAQNAKYAKNIKNYITPKELLNSLNLKTKFIGITGTNGKTTTAFVLGYLLNKLGFNVGIQGTEGFYFNNQLKEPKTLTTPTILTTIKRAFKYNPDFFIMEVSSHAIVQNRIEGIKFSAKILTSFSQDHLDFHKSMQEYKKVKESFLKDETLKVVKGKLKKNCVVDVDGYDFELNCKNLYVLEKPLIEDIPLAGEFNKMNFSLALKTAELLSAEKLEKLKNIAKTFSAVPGRMEIVAKNPLVIIDFAHTPDGMEKVLSAVEGKKIVVFGAGGNRDRDKRHLMGEVASKLADFIFVTNDNPRCENPQNIAKDIIKDISKPYEVILDRKEAIKKALKLAKEKNATLFILGKGNEKYIEFCNKKVAFCDKEVVKEIL